MKTSRPVYLNVMKIRMPMSALVSILHRASGFLLFLFIPFLLWVLQQSLASNEGFQALHQAVTSPTGKVLLWIFLSAFIYHLLAGIRHLRMDMGFGESLAGGRASAQITLFLSIVLIILTGVWLW